MSTVITWTDDAGAVVSMVFDVDNQETHEFSTQITEHPVEQGADVADHVRDELESFRLEGYVSDSPTVSNGDISQSAALKTIELQIPEMPTLISLSGAISAGVSAVGSAIFGAPKPPKAQIVTFDNTRSRKKQTLELLNKTRTQHKLIRILTKMKDYENMLIQQITATRAPQDGTGANFVVAFREVEFVSSEIVAAPKPSEPIGSTRKTAGSKNAKDSKKPELVSGLERIKDTVTHYFSNDPRSTFF